MKDIAIKLELDHFFIIVEPEAKIADLLIEVGLEESYSRVHPGQGTANRCFNFSNSMMELLWLSDETEAKLGPGSGLNFPLRSANKEASPFGLIFNRKDNTSLEMPFNGWSYQPDYFSSPMAFHVGNNSKILIEPLCIYIPFMEPAERVIEQGAFQSISSVHIQVLAESLSEELMLASQSEGLTIECGEEHLMEVTFANRMQGLSKDLRPNLPLILHY